MRFRDCYCSPLGKILLEANETGLTGLWFEGQKYAPRECAGIPEQKETPVFERAKEWLDLYFSGREPGVYVPLHLEGTAFQMEVWEILCSIPYGQTMTYGQIGKQIAKKRGIAHMSAQAVGGAVGHNRIALLVPCHRVIGSDGSLVGYAGGAEKKRALLGLEGVL